MSPLTIVIAQHCPSCGANIPTGITIGITFSCQNCGTTLRLVEEGYKEIIDVHTSPRETSPTPRVRGNVQSGPSGLKIANSIISVLFIVCLTGLTIDFFNGSNITAALCIITEAFSILYWATVDADSDSLGLLSSIGGVAVIVATLIASFVFVAQFTSMIAYLLLIGLVIGFIALFFNVCLGLLTKSMLE
jgi:hypothetical protein